MNAQQAAIAYLNGQKNDARAWLKRCSKLQLMEFMESLTLNSDRMLLDTFYLTQGILKHE